MVRLSERWQCELKMITIEEGQEEEQFWDVVGDRQYPTSLLLGGIHVLLQFFFNLRICCGRLDNSLFVVS